MSAQKKLSHLLDHLVELSVENYYNPYKAFVWPERLEGDQFWMSPELLSVHGTPYMEQLTETQLWELSKWESVNFFSFNVHGIRGLIQHALSCIHTSSFTEISEYLHHFIGEENEHMWFFAQFCNRYGGKIYHFPKLESTAFAENDIDHYVAFCKILISEQIGDYYNKYMQADDRLHPLVQQINRIHHEDESRHIAMGRRIVQVLHEELSTQYPPERLEEVETYLRKYALFLLESFYNPHVYRDAGLPEPYAMRRELLHNPVRAEFHRKVLKNTTHFLKSNGIFAQEII